MGAALGSSVYLRLGGDGDWTWSVGSTFVGRSGVGRGWKWNDGGGHLRWSQTTEDKTNPASPDWRLGRRCGNCVSRKSGGIQLGRMFFRRCAGGCCLCPASVVRAEQVAGAQVWEQLISLEFGSLGDGRCGE